MHRRIVGSYLVVIFLAVTVTIAKGAEFNVSNLTDFQSALTTAQSNGEDDIINVAPGLYTLDATLTYTLTAESSENHSLTIPMHPSIFQKECL